MESEKRRQRDFEMWAKTPPRYAEWLDFFFGRFERDCDSEWEMDWTFECEAPAVADLVIHTLGNCGRDLSRYSDGQVAIGLKALLMGGLSDVPERILSSQSSDDQKVAILRSLRPLYEDCFAKRSPPVLGHLSESQLNPIEYVTYMLWDVSPLGILGQGSRARFLEIIDVLAFALRLPNEACIESALHGLGHMRGKDAQAAIDKWLDGNPKISPALLSYAHKARVGHVL